MRFVASKRRTGNGGAAPKDCNPSRGFTSHRAAPRPHDGGAPAARRRHSARVPQAPPARRIPQSADCGMAHSGAFRRLRGLNPRARIPRGLCAPAQAPAPRRAVKKGVLGQGEGRGAAECGGVGQGRVTGVGLLRRSAVGLVSGEE